MTSSYNEFFRHLCTRRALAPDIYCHLDSEAVSTFPTRVPWRGFWWLYVPSSWCSSGLAREFWIWKGERLHRKVSRLVCLCWCVRLPSNVHWPFSLSSSLLSRRALALERQLRSFLAVRCALLSPFPCALQFYV